MTRRQAVGGAAVLGAGLLLPAARPPRAGAAIRRRVPLPTRVPLPRELFSLDVGHLHGESRVFRTARPFALVGVEWQGPLAPPLQIRTRGSGAWSRWAAAAVAGHAPDAARALHAAPAPHAAGSPRAEARRVGEALWSGRAELVQLRSNVPLRSVRLHFVATDHAPAGAPAGASSAPPASSSAPSSSAPSSSAPSSSAPSSSAPSSSAPSSSAAAPTAAPAARPGARAAASYPLAQPVLPSGGGQPPIIARRAWGGGAAPAAFPPGFGAVELAFVHHTENLNGYSAHEVPAMLLAIYQFHRFIRGWNDIGYNFIVDLYGRIWEARQGGVEQAVIGAQAGGYNAVSTGVAVLGSFTGAQPTPAAMVALRNLLSWKLALHGVPVQGHVVVEVDPSDYFYTSFRPGQRVSLPRIAGHRDGDSTDCPGDALYGQLPALRRATARRGAGQARRMTLAAPQVLLAGGSADVHGRLTTLSRRIPVAGVTVEVQALRGARRHSLGRTLTAPDGSFAFSLTPQHSLTVAAVATAQPAAVSPPAEVAVAPVVTIQLATGPQSASSSAGGPSSTGAPSSAGEPSSTAQPPRVRGTVSPAKERVLLQISRRLRGKLTHLPAQTVKARNGAFSARLKTPGPGRYEVIATVPADSENAAGASAPLTLRLD